MSNNYNTKLQTNNTDLQEVLELLETKAAGGEQATPEITVNSNGLITATAGTKSSTKQLTAQGAKTITPSTSEQTAVVSGRYTTGDVKVAAMPTATQATPSISINSNGLITASATQTAGYVTAGTKSATKQLTTQAAKIITPSTLDQVAISSGVYATGAVAVKGDVNLVAENIVSGKSIFGVAGTATADGSGSSDMEDALVAGTLTEYTNNRVTNIGRNAFFSYTSLTTVSFPVCTSIGSSAFYYCTSLTSVNFPVCTSIGSDAFNGCSRLTTINFPVCTTIGRDALYGCSSLTTVSFPVCTTIFASAFYNCYKLTTVNLPVCKSIFTFAFGRCRALSSITLGASTVCTLSNSSAFYQTPYTGYSSYFSGTPYIYVPASLLTKYQSATNWAYFSSRFVGIDDGSGGNVGEPETGANMITFKINDIDYQAEEGMIWEEWCDSQYNTLGLYSNGYDILKVEGTLTEYLYNQSYDDGLAKSTIIANHIYTLAE